MIFALAGKAIGAIQIAGMGHMQTKSLHHAGSLLLEFPCHLFKSIGGKELSFLLQFPNLIIAGGNFLPVYIFHMAKLRHHGVDDFFLAFFFIKADDFISDIIHHMHAAGAGIQHNGQTAQLIPMNHNIFFPYHKKCRHRAAFRRRRNYLLSFWALFSHC